MQYNYDMVWLIEAKLYKYVSTRSRSRRPAIRCAKRCWRCSEFDLPMTGKMMVDGHHVNKPVYLLTVEKGEFVPMAKID